MNVWRGSDVALLTPADELNRYQPNVLQKIVGALDRAWNFYARVTGREPSLFQQIDGLATVAVVPSTCGAGCAFLGQTGIEIGENPYFNSWMYDAVSQTNQYDQILFYELGRNFWFYGDQLRSLPTDAATSFAIANRFLSMSAAGLEGAPFNPDSTNLAFNEFRTSILDDLSQFYFEAPGLNWSNTILANTPPPNPRWGATDFLASLFARVYEDFGEEVYSKMWQTIGASPGTNDSQSATNLLINSASTASGIDYGFLLKGVEWRFAVGSRGDDRLDTPTTIAGQTPVIQGFGGQDTLRGGQLDDLMFGGSGDDTLWGFAGNDTAVGGTGNDRIWGGEGDDHLYGGDGYDLLLGNTGNDSLIGGKGNDLLQGGAGRDRLDGGKGNDQLISSGDGDLIILRPGEGLDTIFGYQDGVDAVALDNGLKFEDLKIVQKLGRTLIQLQATGESLASFVGICSAALDTTDFQTRA
jgi:serralysin